MTEADLWLLRDKGWVEEWTGKGHKETFHGDGNVLYLDYGNSQNSSDYTLKMDE